MEPPPSHPPPSSLLVPPPPSSLLIPRNPRFSETSFIDPEVVEIPPPISRRSRIAKQKQVGVAVPEIINLDEDEVSSSPIFLDRKVDMKGKGKSIQINSSASTDYQVEGFVPKTPKSISSTLGMLDSVDVDPFCNINNDCSGPYVDDAISSEKYAKMQDYFDSVDIPTSIEANIPWFLDSTQNKKLDAGISNWFYEEKPVNGNMKDVSPPLLLPHTVQKKRIMKDISSSLLLHQTLERKRKSDVPQRKRMLESIKRYGKEAPTGAPIPPLVYNIDSQGKYIVDSQGAPTFSLSHGAGPSFMNKYPTGANQKSDLHGSGISSSSSFGFKMPPKLTHWPSPATFSLDTADNFTHHLNAINISKEPMGDTNLVEDPPQIENNIDEILSNFQQFKQFDTVQCQLGHHYLGQGSSLKQPSKSWSKKIQDEWKILEKDLPDTIFVRVYESRMDLLRAVIVGAEGTPYHDGLFFFDVHFPSGYPSVPPLVYYYSGGLRLNPNLYNSGKVCLSLLGTWSGSKNEKWISGTSTMLQVLVSIQALILNKKPFYNEPGYELMSGTEQGEKRSEEYSEKAFILSAKTMIYTMRKPPKHFEDFVYGHFHKCGHDILAACKAYMDGAPVGSLVKGGVQVVEESDKSCSKGFKESVAAIRSLLVKEFTRLKIEDCERFLNDSSKGGVKVVGNK